MMDEPNWRLKAAPLFSNTPPGPELRKIVVNEMSATPAERMTAPEALVLRRTVVLVRTSLPAITSSALGASSLVVLKAISEPVIHVVSVGESPSKTTRRRLCGSSPRGSKRT